MRWLAVSSMSIWRSVRAHVGAVCIAGTAMLAILHRVPGAGSWRAARRGPACELPLQAVRDSAILLKPACEPHGAPPLREPLRAGSGRAVGRCICEPHLVW